VTVNSVSASSQALQPVIIPAITIIVATLIKAFFNGAFMALPQLFDEWLIIAAK